jgi:hypothetical protein
MLTMFQKDYLIVFNHLDVSEDFLIQALVHS